MTLQVYNTLTQSKEDFIPLQAPKVNMYVCGVTVYDYCHIGHARAYVVFDMIRRYLEHKGYAVNHIQNFTDVDDKIIKRAGQDGKQINEITRVFIDAYYEDMRALGVKDAHAYPKATENIQGMVSMIKALIDKGHAYEVNGEVFFKVESFKGYGKLSKRKLDDQEAGSRVDVNSHKKNPHDFTLWKPSKPGEPAWDSPWGKGRPGWHIECSVMSLKEAGIETLDIHGGGQDLIFPHHENEIAQSEAYTGKPFSKYWLHNGFVTINREKMSKSLGNFFTVREVLKKYPPEVIRFFILSTHYRSPISYSDEQLDEAKKGLDRLYEAVYENMRDGHNDDADYLTYEAEFTKYMDDDLNSAGAIGALFTLATVANKNKSKKAAQLLKKLGDVLGLLQSEQKKEILPEEIEVLIQKRQDARKNKDFKTSDLIRDELLAKGIILKDTPQGVRWEKK